MRHSRSRLRVIIIGKLISFFVSSTATYYCFVQYIYWKGTATDTIVVTNLSKLFESLSRNKYTWLSSGIISAVLLVVILLIVLVLRKRIVIAIALVKEGSKYVFHSLISCFDSFYFDFRAVSSITSTVFFPIFPWIFQIAIIGFALIVGLYLASVGDPVNQIVRMNDDQTCVCTGPAEHYKDMDVCDPLVFNQYCQDTSARAITFFDGAPTSRGCKTAACNFKEIKSPKVVTYFQVSSALKDSLNR